MTNEKNDKGQNAVNISDFLRPKHFHINSCEEPPIPVWLNNSLSLYCTVTHCVAIAWSPHISWLISLWLGLYGHSWPSHFNPFAPFYTQYGHCNNEGSFKVDCVSLSAAKQESTPCGHDLLSWSCLPSLRNLPLDIPGEIFGGDLAWVGQGWPQHLRFRSCRSFSLHQVLLGESRFCPCEDLQYVLGDCASAKPRLFLCVIYLVTAIAFTSWITALWHKEGILCFKILYGH